MEELTRGIIFAGGSARFDEARARAMAEDVWRELREIGTEAFPCMVDREEDLRFIYQWDEEPPVLTVMRWDEVMWRDLARVEVPIR